MVLFVRGAHLAETSATTGREGRIRLSRRKSLRGRDTTFLLSSTMPVPALAVI